MKIVVTGGAGFIGHNVVSMLEQQGHEVIIIDICTDYGFIPKDEINSLIIARRKKYLANEHTFNILDVANIEWTMAAFKPDVVIHMASFPRQKAVSVDPCYAANVMCVGLTNMLEASVKNNVSKFVYISSSMVYGNFEADITENSVCKPQGQYGIFKYMGEKLVEDYGRRTGMAHVIIRPSAVYGELDVMDRVVSKFMFAAINGQTLIVNGPDEALDFTYVLDAARGIAQATVSDQTNDKIYNITCSGERQWTLLEAAELAVAITGKGNVVVGPRDPSFPKRGRLSIQRARTDFNYEPKVDVEEGFHLYHKWMINS
jgi:nucleoside-diphosphate-sugar epimerase